MMRWCYLFSIRPTNSSFIVHAYWKNSPHVSMSLHSNSSSWFWANQFLLLLLIQHTSQRGSKYQYNSLWFDSGEQEEFEDTKGVIRIRKSTTQWPKEKGQATIYKTHKNKYGVTRTSLKHGVNTRCSTSGTWSTRLNASILTIMHVLPRQFTRHKSANL
jgi:hypothetical protein